MPDFPRAKILFLALLISFTTSCEEKLEEEASLLFTAVSPTYSGITFSNNLEYTRELNPFTAHNFYNGGGVATGDINNDGLPDIFFCGNLTPNKLYLNLGNFKFKDISEQAHISSDGIWYSGATFVDINSDGLLDIYLSRAADLVVGWRGNELLINNGNNTFTDRAAEYGLTGTGFSTHAAFFDLENDGDLDCYLLSNSNRSSSQYNPIKGQRNTVARSGGNKLYRNDHGHFTDITTDAGIFSSVIGFGLGVTISDINKDGWQDIYVSNDFFERDYLYINNHRGGFTESLEKYIRELSMFSMGSDIADFNNDGFADIYVTDMLPEDEGRIKSKTTFDTWEKYQSNLNKGYYQQFLRNVLQLNRGPICRDSCEFYFSEIGRMAGVHATDWSWGALMADFNNDGWKDIFVANGMYKDVTDQDFIQFMANDSLAHMKFDNLKLLELLPSHPIASFAFMNMGDLSFTNKSSEWGLDTPGFSNGAAYADLDKDGDLDLVTNNLNRVASVYRNNTNNILPNNKFLKVELRGEGNNTFGIGTKVTAYYNGTLDYLEQMPARGFQSCIDHTLTFGLGESKLIDSLVVEWPGGKNQTLKNVNVNQKLTLRQSEAHAGIVTAYRSGDHIFRENGDRGIDYTHHEDTFVDFNRDKLTYQMLSTAGPRIACADVNGDALDDLYMPGAKGQAGELFVQLSSGSFKKIQTKAFELDKMSEDTDALFADVDNDRDLDLVVTSGGNVYPAQSEFLNNRLYINNGKGNFSKSANALPIAKKSFNFSTVSAADYDSDGDIDFFVGGRSIPDKYGYPCDGAILQNDGKGIFTDVTSAVAPGLAEAGMITDSEWFDSNGDDQPDLVITGEFMKVRIFQNQKGTFKETTDAMGLEKSAGWWNRLAIADVNGDGLQDIIAGNHGLNSRFKAKESKPVTLYYGDVDDNNTYEQILCTYNGDKQYPMVLRHDMVGLLPFLKKKFLKYEDYKEKTMAEIFTQEQLGKMKKIDAYVLESSIFLNAGKGRFERRSLPAMAQVSPAYAIAVNDFTGDSFADILIGGNFYQSKPEAGIYDASYGVLLAGDGKGNFKEVPYSESNLLLKGAIRDFVNVKTTTGNLVVVGKNNLRPEFLTW